MCWNCENEHGVIRHPAEVLRVTPSIKITELLPLFSVYGDGNALFQDCPQCGGQVKGIDERLGTWAEVFEWLWSYEPPMSDDAEGAAIQ